MWYIFFVVGTRVPFLSAKHNYFSKVNLISLGQLLCWSNLNYSHLAPQFFLFYCLFIYSFDFIYLFSFLFLFIYLSIYYFLMGTAALSWVNGEHKSPSSFPPPNLAPLPSRGSRQWQNNVNKQVFSVRGRGVASITKRVSLPQHPAPSDVSVLLLYPRKCDGGMVWLCKLVKSIIGWPLCRGMIRKFVANMNRIEAAW